MFGRLQAADTPVQPTAGGQYTSDCASLCRLVQGCQVRKRMGVAAKKELCQQNL